MMRVHCIFSAAQTHTSVCKRCGRTFDEEIKELQCTKGTCKPLTEQGRRDISVIAPRDEQEEADTFAYVNSGPERDGARVGPSRLVIVHPGDNEADFKTQNAEAIDSWTAGGHANAVQPVHGLMTPDETPSPPSGRAVVDLTGDDEQVPATPSPAYMGKGKRRAMDHPAVDLTGDQEHVPAAPFPSYEGKGKGRAMDYPTGVDAEGSALPKKRAGDFSTEEEPVAKRAMVNVSSDETEASAVRSSTDLAAELLAEHEADFPEGDYADLAGMGSPSDAAFGFDAAVMPAAVESNADGFPPTPSSGGAAFGYDAPVMPDAVESNANGVPDGVGSFGAAPFGYDDFVLQGASESDANGFGFEFDFGL